MSSLGHILRRRSYSTSTLPLSGVRVLELGQLIAGPFAGQLLGQFGAEVIKIEPPVKGDPLRVWRELDVDGVSPWFRSIGRNKKSVAIDLHSTQGRDLVRDLALQSDVLIENFKPGTLEKWGLDPASLHPHNPDLIYTRVSGYGQTGPWASRPGYASVCEAESGFRYINGFVDVETGGLSGPPVRPNISLGDSVAGLHAAFGTVLALLQRQKKRDVGEKGGMTVDVSILESMLNLMEGIVPEYDRKNKVRGPSGSSVTGIVPTNAYPCLPDPAAPMTPVYIVIGANGDSIYARLMKVIGAPHLIGPDYAQNHHRVSRKEEIETAISAWTSNLSAEEVEKKLAAEKIPVGRVLSVREIVSSEQVVSRGAIQDVKVDSGGWDVKMPGTFPVLEGCDSAPRWAGPDLGAHTSEVLATYLDLTPQQIQKLRNDGVSPAAMFVELPVQDRPIREEEEGQELATVYDRCTMEIGPHSFLETSFSEVQYSWQSAPPTHPYHPYYGAHNPLPAPAHPPSNVMPPSLFDRVHAAAVSNPLLANQLALAANGRATEAQMQTLGLLIQSIADSPHVAPYSASPAAPQTYGYPPPQPPVPVPTKEFDIIFNFKESLHDKSLLPRKLATCDKVEGPHLGVNEVCDVLLRILLDPPTKVSTEPGTERPTPQVVTIWLRQPHEGIWDMLRLWIGGEEKIRENAIALDELEVVSLLSALSDIVSDSNPQKKTKRVYLKNRSSDTALIAQLRTAGSNPAHAMKLIKPTKWAARAKRKLQPRPQPPVPVIANEAPAPSVLSFNIPPTAPASTVPQRRPSETPLPEAKRSHLSKPGSSQPPVTIRCLSCLQTDVPLILGGRFCRPCVDSGRAVNVYGSEPASYQQQQAVSVTMPEPPGS
ncbi:unnamed protein product [Mycena citricolor]|uniref:CoA-transferase family III n=1 Tax=Mycena citricolor TaxID=2018698 RepID=A0AAD2GVS4_9AGAR|nr:unnamed protein product [Mycena citricolor]